MKEKLIAFTRNKINLIWMIILSIVVGLMCLALPTIEISSMGIIGVILLLIMAVILNILILLGFAIWLLFFEEDEEKVRNNNFFILLLSMDQYMWLPIFGVIDFVYRAVITMLGISFGILGGIIVFIGLVLLSFFLADIVAKHFSEKIN